MNQHFDDPLVVRKDYDNPPLLDTQDKVDRANAFEKHIGRKNVWRLGDHCYWVFPPLDS